MRKKPIRPKRPAGKSPIAPPVLVNRPCRPARRTGPGTPRQKLLAGPEKQALTVGEVRGEVKAVGIWIGHLREVMAAMRPRTTLMAILPVWSGETPPPPPMVGRVCRTARLEIRATDLVAFLGALQKQVDALEQQLALSPQDLVLKQPPKRTRVR